MSEHEYWRSMHEASMTWLVVLLFVLAILMVGAVLASRADRRHNARRRALIVGGQERDGAYCPECAKVLAEVLKEEKK